MDKIGKLKRKLQRTQKRYCHLSLRKAADISETSLLSKMKVYKDRNKPAAQHIIHDVTTKESRLCRSDKERLEATRQHHSKWMSKSKSKRTCLFVDLKSDQEGINGITLHPERKLSNTDAKELVPEWDSLNQNIKEAYRNAHGQHMAQLFKPAPANSNLKYPFYIKNKTGDFSSSETEKTSGK